LSCVPPFVQLAGAAALRLALDERDAMMREFHTKVFDLVGRLNNIPDVTCLEPGGSFYAFPCVAEICNRHHITSHGLAMFLLEAADENRGVACLGGECFGDAGGGFLRLSCSEPAARIVEAVDFIGASFLQSDRLARYLHEKPQFRLLNAYVV
jgi:aspartate aminotransferase